MHDSAITFVGVTRIEGGCNATLLVRHESQSRLLASRAAARDAVGVKPVSRVVEAKLQMIRNDTIRHVVWSSFAGMRLCTSICCALRK
jgi:hypothetical protein